MGIKGIYEYIGTGQRIALSKLSVEHYEKTGRPLRIAVDISIWQFQIQSGKGGSNPALRTLYYRLVRLLSLAIQPIFVFDGPNKPPFKRNKATRPGTASLPNMLAKQMLKLFGFPYVTAPGEAEAECALFQREGLVDVVLTEDVDVLMFGSTISLRNWSSQGTRGSKVPTHISVYDMNVIKEKSGLDNEGMVLVALMSGGDYIPAGIAGCGAKTAIEAAKAGFGHDLCSLSRKDSAGLQEWRTRLEQELRSNKSGFFRTKHKSWTVPDTFPDKTVLSYYLRPAVSTPEKMAELRLNIKWDGQVDIDGLRNFVAEAFDWLNIAGAKKFIRGLAPALMPRKLLDRRHGVDGVDDDLDRRVTEEGKTVRAICGRRLHAMTDGTPELRVLCVPTDIVGLDLTKEEPDINFVTNSSDSEIDAADSAGEDGSRSRSPVKRTPSVYDPTQPEKMWIAETFVKIGVPLTVETWEEDMRNPKKVVSRKARERNASKKSKTVNHQGALNSFFTVSKPGVEGLQRIEERLSPDLKSTINASLQSTKGTAMNITQKHKVKAKKKESKEVAINPWSLSQRPIYSAPGICASVQQNGEKSIGSPAPSEVLAAVMDLSAPAADKKHPRPFSTSVAYSQASSPTKPSLDPKAQTSNQSRSGASPRKEQLPPTSRNKQALKGRPLNPLSITDEQSPANPLNFSSMTTISSHVAKTSQRGSGAKTPSRRRCSSSASSSSSLPSPSALFTPVRGRTENKAAQQASLGTREEFQKSRRRVVVRESLEGAWKDVGDQEFNVTPKRILSGVEIVDLTLT